MTPLYGQSNALGFGNPMGRVVTLDPVAPGRALSFNGGTRLTPADASRQVDEADLRSLIDARERVGIGSITDRPPIGETPCSGIGWALTQSWGLPPDTAILIATTAIAGAGIYALRRGTPGYTNLVRAVAAGARIAAARGLAFDVPAVFYLQGEGDYKSTYANYRRDLSQLQADLEADIREITRQPSSVPLIYAVPCSWTRQDGLTTCSEPQVFVDVALSAPSRFCCAGPLYPFQHTDGMHLTPASARAVGELFGASLVRRLRRESTMLYAARASLRGNNVVVDYAGGEGALVLDAIAVSDPGGAGFRVLDAGGEPLTVATVSVHGTRLTLSLTGGDNERPAKISVAASSFLGARAGPEQGPRSCLRDSASVQGSNGLPIYRWACVQTLAIADQGSTDQ